MGGKCFHPQFTWSPPGNYPTVRTLRDMTEAEIAALEKKYGCPVKRPGPKTCNRFEGGSPTAPRTAVFAPETVPSQSFNPPRVNRKGK